MKNVMYSIGLMAAVVLAGVNVFFVVQDGKKDLLSVVETKATVPTNGVENCDIYKYQKYATEAWEQVKVMDGKIEVNGESKYIGNVGGSAEANVYVRVPVCKGDQYNCCLKSHLDKNYRFP